MIRSLFAFTILLLSVQCFADDRRDKLIGLINEEMREVSRLSRTIGHKNPNHLLRLAELNLEKARLVKETENERYLKQSSKKRSRSSKAKYFRGSRKLFKEAQKISHIILKKYRKFSGKNIVYYILAFNYKEFGQYKKARQYLKQAVKHSKRGSRIEASAQLTLADLLYNEAKYKRARPLYVAALSKKRDKWWTKNAYNLAWCYYRIGYFNKAISTLKEVLQYSKKSSYVDMSRDVNRNIALFFTAAGKTDKAVAFYIKQGKNAARKLLSVAKNLLDQAKPTKAEKILDKAESLADTYDDKLEIYLLKLRLFEKYGKHAKHLATSKKIMSLNREKVLPGDSMTSFKYHVKKLAAVLQKQAVGKTYKGVSSVRKKKGELATEYFAIIGELEGKKSYKSLLHSAETNFAIGKHDKAVADYQKVFDISPAKALKVKKVAINGLLAALGSGKVSNATQKKYLEGAYTRYLSIDKRSKRSKKIYQKLFNIYMGRKDISRSEKVLKKYQTNYPRDLVLPEAMLAKIMEYLRQNKKMSEFKNYIARINRGEFKVSKKYKTRLKQLLLTMQFEGVEKANSKGDKLAALRGYILIYNDVKSSKDARKNAAYNVSVLFYELGQPDKIIKWLNRSFDLMNTSDLLKFESSLFSMATNLLYRRRFDDASSIYALMGKKLCNKRSKKKSLYFKNNVLIYLSQKKFTKAESVVRAAVKCGVDKKTIKESKVEILNSYSSLKYWDRLAKYANKLLAEDRFYWPYLIDVYFTLARVYRENGRTTLYKKFQDKGFWTYRKVLKSGEKVTLKTLDEVAKAELKKLERMIIRMHRSKLRFPEKRFNATLQGKFKALDKVTSKSIEILKIGSGAGIVKSYQLLIESYQRLAKEISDFTPPKRSADYVKSFKASMESIYTPLIEKSRQFLKEAREKIGKNRILSRDNYWFRTKQRIPLPLFYKYSKSGILMDRGGRR